VTSSAPKVRPLRRTASFTTVAVCADTSKGSLV
ncbi:hypothetical protein D031_2373B, partial [Vibrio parahaemolyticus VP-48]